MTIAQVVTRGYGSFGSVNLLPTWGYGVAVAPIIPVPSVPRSIPRITQPRASGAYTGRRYGPFALKRIAVPDFMHGTMDIRPHVLGTIFMRSHLSGKLSSVPHLYGDIRINP